MNDLRAFIEKLHIANPGEKEEQLLKYMEGVLEWNEKVNLTAITDRDEFIQKHGIFFLIFKA